MSSRSKNAVIPTEPLEPADLLTSGELAGRLKVDRCWIYNQMKTSKRRKNPNPLPAIRMTRYLRFSWREVSAWLQSRRVNVGGAR
jgi:predicted DNA-binding transcriptional regulator AlpA